MEKIFDITKKNRLLLVKFLNETPIEQLAIIPQGFNNNMWWNIVHVIVTEQLLAYKLSGLPMNIENKWVKGYAKGTFPDHTPTNVDIEEIKALALSLVEKTQKDYHEGLFKLYNSYTTSVNITLNCIEDALQFNVFHEGLHLGSLLALKRATQV